MKKMTVRKMSALALFLAMAVILSYVESFIPSWVPGVKLGLANLIIILLLYEYSWYDALLIDIGRVFLASLIRGNIFTMPFYMSLAGALMSFLVMALAHYFLKRLTVYGVSILGAYFHSLAQVFVASLFVESWSVFFYFPFISLLSMATGLLTAFVAEKILRSGVIARAKGEEGMKREEPPKK
jgi:heptaprenyl diphosphate synthase